MAGPFGNGSSETHRGHHRGYVIVINKFGVADYLRLLSEQSVYKTVMTLYLAYKLLGIRQG